ncbi:MAG: hypothetical protein JW839_06575 [Candidatus Lokiarchaeota archaeon]|nr:hypothetical protein [Candidatus Lokiarchaeota archaeon]
MAPTPNAQDALDILRQPPADFQWYVIPLLLIVIYVYAVEAEKKNWPAVMAAVSFWGLDLFNEIWNSLVFHFTNYSAVWVEPGGTVYLILIGLNIETTFMFAIMGIVSTKLIPKDKDAKIFGKLPNRPVIALVMAALCVVVEVFLNLAGALTWDYPWWNLQAPWLIYLVGYLPFWVVAFIVYDARSMKTRAKIVGTILLVDLACIAVFMPIGWI